MSEQETFLNRIGRFFKRSPRPNGDTLTDPLTGEVVSNEESRGAAMETRGAIVKPWGRNNQAIAQLQEGFQSLNELMGAIKQNMDSQARRQDELLQHLSALPKVLDSIPESSRIQGETLKAIHQQLVHQAGQQETLGEILEKMSEAGGDQKDLLEGLRERVETLNHQDKAMADSLNTVGNALESVSKNSATSAEVLGSMRDNLRTRDTELEKVLHRQGTRFTTMLAIGIFLSIAACAAVAIMGYMMYTMKQGH